jgi:NTE family protein
MEQPTIGIALGGGGARGFAHVGVLQVLHEEEIPIHVVAGTSMGSMVGAMYAETRNPFIVEERFNEFIRTEAYAQIGLDQVASKIDQDASFWDQLTSEIRGRWALQMARSRLSLVKPDQLIEALKFLIQADTFEQCQLPLNIVATDLSTGQDVVFATGDLRLAVRASSSVPGYLPPVQYNDQLLSDGGITCPVPVKYVRQSQVDIVIAVAVPPPITVTEPVENAIDLLTRAEQITSHYYSSTLMNEADIEILPEIQNVQWNDFHRMTDMIQAGRDAAIKVIPVIREMMRQRIPWWQLLWQRFNRRTEEAAY